MLWLLWNSDPAAAEASCLDAASAAEIRNRIPAGLLKAIGHVESGGWSWSVNGNDALPGRHFADVDAARRYAQGLFHAGRRMVDLGCFQVDLFYHPEAFGSWETAFDDDANADAAAHILSRLHARFGDWNQAVASYHSADPTRGQPYLQSVLAAWTEHFDISGTTLPSPADPYVIMAVPVPGLTIWDPSGRMASASRKGSTGLPRIIAP